MFDATVAVLGFAQASSANVNDSQAIPTSTYQFIAFFHRTVNLAVTISRIAQAVISWSLVDWENGSTIVAARRVVFLTRGKHFEDPAANYFATLRQLDDEGHVLFISTPCCLWR